MNDCLYKHVLFKDLKEYLRREDYMGGYTPTERSWIRKNLGITNTSEVTDTTLQEIIRLIQKQELIPGNLYMFDYLTDYKVIVMAYSKSNLLKNVILLTNDINCLLWDVKFDIFENKIVYLKDQNGNEANFDFKNLKITVQSEEVYAFRDQIGNENSKNCKGNNILHSNNVSLIGDSNYNIIKGSNILFKNPINNCIVDINNKTIELDDLDLTDGSTKQIITINDKNYIDYLDSQTLTHQFYEL